MNSNSVWHQNKKGRQNNQTIRDPEMGGMNSKRTVSENSLDFQCNICLEATTENFRLAKCACAFCTEVSLLDNFSFQNKEIDWFFQCLTQYVRYEISVGKSKIECPETNCKNGEIDTIEVEQFVDEEMFQKFLDLMEDKSIFLSKNLKWCPAPDCNTICKVQTKSSASKTTCPKCQREFCSKCSENWTEHSRKCNSHSNVSAQDDTVKSCPGCQVAIFKQDGCAHVTCSYCKTGFCWKCLTKINHFDIMLNHKCNGEIRWERIAYVLFYTAMALSFVGLYELPIVLIIPLTALLCSYHFLFLWSMAYGNRFVRHVIIQLPNILSLFLIVWPEIRQKNDVQTQVFTA